VESTDFATIWSEGQGYMGTKVQVQESRREDMVPTLTPPYTLLARDLHPSYSQLVHKQRSLGLHFCALILEFSRKGQGNILWLRVTWALHSNSGGLTIKGWCTLGVYLFFVCNPLRYRISHPQGTSATTGTRSRK
jgi:hypothetical protein